MQIYNEYIHEETLAERCKLESNIHIKNVDDRGNKNYYENATGKEQQLK